MHRTPTSTRAFLVREVRSVVFDQAVPRPSYPSLRVVVVLVLLAACWAASRGSPLYGIAVVSIAAFAAAAALMLRRTGPPEWRLQCVYRGQLVDLYSTADARVFNQVEAALSRAIADGSRSHTVG